jgi:hypothetical protein
MAGESAVRRAISFARQAFIPVFRVTMYNVEKRISLKPINMDVLDTEIPRGKISPSM